MVGDTTITKHDRGINHHPRTIHDRGAPPLCLDGSHHARMARLLERAQRARGELPLLRARRTQADERRVLVELGRVRA